ncbi:MAG TPA: hypothetical protein GXX37_00280 [Clostridiaceae bacterium]|nr:hypothetical protein [Clostridiaceae bacterium]
MNLTSRERIMRIIQGKPVDRPAVKLWGLQPGQKLLHPNYKQVYDLAIETTDLFCGVSSPFDFITGASTGFYEIIKRPKSEEWTEVETLLHTPEGVLSSIRLKSNTGKPGYTLTHFIKEPDDIKKILSIPYEPYPVSLESYYKMKREIGDNGIVMFSLGHAGYAVQRLMGSELLALFSVDERELLKHLIEVFAERLRNHVKAALDAGLGDRGKEEDLVFGWVGPELLIPPLLSYKDFNEFCFEIDKPLMDMIHEAGGNIWIHCHGKVGRLIKCFAEMGCDVLNPIEPPPMGDISLEDAFKEAAGRMALEGNIEIHEIMEASGERLIELIEDAVKTGAKYGRFILCQSSNYMAVPKPPETMLRNLMIYVRYGVEYAKKYHY